MNSSCWLSPSQGRTLLASKWSNLVRTNPLVTRKCQTIYSVSEGGKSSDQKIISLRPWSRDSNYFVMTPKDIIVGKPKDHDDTIDWLMSQHKFTEALDKIKAPSKIILQAPYQAEHRQKVPGPSGQPRQGLRVGPGTWEKRFAETIPPFGR